MNDSEGSSVVSGAQLNFSRKPTMNYATIYPDASVEPSARENSNGSGTTLKEHDYIGLSEVSSANSSSEKHLESGRRVVLDLNESATVLRLGPPAFKPNGKSNGEDQESRNFSDVTDCYRAVPEAAAEVERSRASSKLDAHGAQDRNVSVENNAKRAAYHHEQKQDAREPGAEPEFAKSLLGGIQRSNAILQEFRMAQALKAAQHPLQAQTTKPAFPNRPMHTRPQDYEAGLKGKHPTSFHAPYNVFPGVKKRAFSEAVGMNVGGSSNANGAPRDGHGEVIGMGGNEQADVKVKSQQGKSWMGGTSLGNNSPVWQTLDISNSAHNPFNMRRTLLNKLQDAGDSSIKASNDASKLNETKAPASNEEPPPPAPNQTVGWPPVRSFVRSFNPVIPAPPPTVQSATFQSAQDKGASPSTNSCLVKIYMDGVPFGRKVDLKTNNSYEKLYPALEEMFQQFISGHYCGSRASSNAESEFVPPSRKLNFLDGSEYVLIYEDHEGDFMLVGDVPWDLFINTVKRLRIMKGSEQVNLAPRSADAMKSQVAGG
ncbi:hypothetical protein M758_10G165600 [Ceratodon purpureus]|uniref:Auxin-responsive protein n=1 Tax=Ceratodon purpureus TaxID=3225 RepID=A0A8T0GL89_CERPU|nr:hypothetical protein KC19_10G170200 [Ceratodon purpureus]KAG0604353.1 hypothetical protein M758_10G165600 [Ceratodon purpureus]